MVNKMASFAMLCKKMQSKAKTNGEDDFMKKKEEFFKMKRFIIEFAENSFILFENEEDYLNIYYLEKVIFYFINNLLYNEDKDKEIRIYFRLSLIEKYLKSLPKYRKIKIFYDEKEYENPYKIKFPFISYMDYHDKRQEYEDIMEELEGSFYENVTLFNKYAKVYYLLHKRIHIQYFKRKQNDYAYDQYLNTFNYNCPYYIKGFMHYDSESESDTESDTESGINTNRDTDTDTDRDTDTDSDIDTDTEY